MKYTETASHRNTGSVVIVDDDLKDIRFTQRVIASVFPQLCTRGVQSGEELIRYLQGENKFSNRTEFPYPIVVLLDLKMPGLNGFDVLRWVEDHPPHNLVAVVVLTVSGEVSLAQRAYKLGARSFLTKPLTANDFKNTISKFENALELVSRG